VNWYDALAYVSWLSKKTGKSYRLSSEAEREYAARAKTTTPYSFEDSISSAVANYDPNVTPVPAVVKGTLPVATFKANGFGLYQMHGNVAEWTQDCWNASYNNSPGDALPFRRETAPNASSEAAHGVTAPPTFVRLIVRPRWPRITIFTSAFEWPATLVSK
jgi:formylglycine-generating enzyme required for sulfatase activity